MTQGHPCATCAAPADGPPSAQGESHCRPCRALFIEFCEANGWPRAPWEVHPHRSALVLGSEGIVWAGPNTRRLPGSLRELGAVAERLGATEVWIHESALERFGWPEAFDRLKPGAAHPRAFFADVGAYQCRFEPPGLTAHCYWYQKGKGGHAFDLHMPAYAPCAPKPFRSPFGGLESAHELFWAISHYYEATKGRLAWKGAGSITSDDWLRRHYRRAGTLVATEEAPPARDGLAPEHDASWARAPLGKETSARYLLAFDANAQYLGAASSIALPAGPCVHAGDWPELAETTPGYWLIEPPVWTGPGPCPWRDPAAAESSAVWVTTPTAWLAHKGYGVEPLEAWVWPEHHQYLRPWYELLRDARAAADIGGPALAAIKSVYKAGLGRLASTTRSRGTEGDPLFQPYWDQAVTALARCNLHRRLVKLRAEPVAVDVDCLFFLTSSPNPGAFAARIGLPFGDGLGEYKPNGARAPAAAAREILGAEGGHPVRALRELVKS